MITNSQTLDDRNTASARCAAYGLIAHGFRYPDEVWYSALEDAARWREWPEWLGHCDEATGPTLRAIQSWISSRDAAAGTSQLQSEYAAAFGHSVRGACPPYELEYGTGEIIQRSSDLADTSGFYAAYGLEMAGAVSERPDHVSVEAEFMAVLCAKEAHGIEHDISELVDSVRSTQRCFLRDHLAGWLPALLRRVRKAGLSDFYSNLADFASAFLSSECARLDVTLGSPYLELRPTDPTAESTQSCGVPGECTPAAGGRFTQLNVSARKGAD